ncbi:hypothetical protein [Streptomyces sp. NPDC090112]
MSSAPNTPTEYWDNLLKRHAFTDVNAEIIPEPAGALGTLLVTAKAA